MSEQADGATAAPAEDGAAALAALRVQGAERVDPLGLAFLTALARRRAAAPEAVQPLLSARFADALAVCRARLAAAPIIPPPASRTPTPLAALVDQLAAARAVPGEVAAPADLKSVRHFGAAWARLSADQQLIEALAQGPENAGPLNSHRLVLQALQRLQTSAPAYLQHFMTYADALLWLDAQAPGRAATSEPGAAAGSGEAPRKRRPSRPRAR